MSELTNKELTELVKKLQSDLSIANQNIARYAKKTASGEEPSGTSKIGDLTAITDNEISDNPQLIFEHATGTKRGYLSQVVEEVTKELPTVASQEEVDAGADTEKSVTPATLRNTTFVNSQIPAAQDNATSSTGFGGIRYAVEGTKFTMILG